ncbi:MAG: HU family DNA-binding protein [bacterium]
MIKRELVVKIAKEMNLTQNVAKSVIEKVLDGITDSLASGEKVELRNFGILKVKSRKSRVGRNPRTGITVPIEAKKVVSFKPGKVLKKKVEKS